MEFYRPESLLLQYPNSPKYWICCETCSEETIGKGYTWATFFKALKQLGVVGPRIVEKTQRYAVYA
uniref:Uncharacterized protein n=1 Tax=Candidatus Kentrum sp. MB TaxID=2138164 RepID=A0A450XS32_9GAMM|nr:MAG: hypothetical protein BECKMB1821G_GA0114241_102833 [Candidatus Kentron sp. MB]VFK32082.1 MAG: hypothetical protein BECKMB1821I_GA0114274_102932 [Candidatus Kentron sp. MB]VFK75652.1 MAG: hypothetical protein BECKMB1821H_GA0114242_102816 [Candidatus Kentron sp. MB]